MSDRTHERTLAALDWAAVLAALARYARTTRGVSRAEHLVLAATVDETRERYAEVAEVVESEAAGDRVPVGGVLDVSEEVARAGNGVTLETPELREVLASIHALDTLRRWAEEGAERSPRLARLAEPIVIDPALLAELDGAFDAHGALSEDRWPELGTLRRRVDALRDRIRHTLDEILRGEEWGESLQDRFFTERDGRFVVPVKMAHRKGLGIVHGTSNSGETAWLEPAAVVELHNELRTTEFEYSRVERRILSELTQAVAVRHVPLLAALEAATDIDLACARAGLGRAIAGVIPTVGTEGVLVLTDARHPILAIRAAETGEDVVPNDLSLTPEHPGLVLTGPNAGGKTVALKTIGLAAVLTRAAIPVPAASARVDFFDPILADVGDSQSVEGGLSTFSAHVGALKASIAGARPGALVLLDEVAVGTDPAQGAALARAVLEAVVDAGARVAVTTHYPELKAVTDHRFVVAAAQYADGKPTYRVELGMPGPSYALAMAERLGLPVAILDRARGLLDEGTRELADRLERLTEERETVRRREAALALREQAHAEQKKALEAAEARLAREGDKRVAALTDKAMARLREREAEVRAMVAALQAGADLRAANTTLAEIRATIAEARAPLAQPAPPSAPPVEVAVGDKVRVRTVGQVGRVTALGEQVEVEIGRLKMRVPRRDLELLGAKGVKAGPAGTTGRVIAAARPVEERPEAPAPRRGDDQASARLRTGANTCDLRGMRADEAIDAAERFLDGLALMRFTPAFLLHGHGTGALKTAVRAWLPSCRYARSWRPADADEGGDAYTVVEIK